MNMIPDQTHGAIKVNEQRCPYLFERMPVCIFVIDFAATPARILDVNRRALLTFGYADAELSGCPATQLVSEEQCLNGLDILQRIRQNENATIETTGRRRDGTTFPIRITGVAPPTSGDRLVFLVEDLSSEKQRRSEAEAIDAERLRIAHEIHDSVAQNLAGLRLKLAMWSSPAGGSPPAMQAAIEELQNVLTSAIEDIRRAIFALRPVDLESYGFYPALTRLVTDFETQNGIMARLDVSGVLDALPLSYELPLFRIVQEGLNNVRNHAHANSMRVTLGVDLNGGVSFSLCDDGCGFDTGCLDKFEQNRHFGLRQMRERIIDLGGMLDIHSAKDLGTELIVSLPPITQEGKHAAD